MLGDVVICKHWPSQKLSLSLARVMISFHHVEVKPICPHQTKWKKRSMSRLQRSGSNQAKSSHPTPFQRGHKHFARLAAIGRHGSEESGGYAPPSQHSPRRPAVVRLHIDHSHGACLAHLRESVPPLLQDDGPRRLVWQSGGAECVCLEKGNSKHPLSTLPGHCEPHQRRCPVNQGKLLGLRENEAVGAAIRTAVDRTRMVSDGDIHHSGIHLLEAPRDSPGRVQRDQMVRCPG